MKNPSTDDGARLAYDIVFLSRMTSLSRSVIYEHISAGLLRITKVGRRTIIMHDDATQWLASFRNN